MYINIVIKRLVCCSWVLLLGQLPLAQTKITEEDYTKIQQLNIEAQQAIEEQDYPKAVLLWQQASEDCQRFGNFLGALGFDIQAHYYTQYFLRADVKPIIVRMKNAINQCDSVNSLVVNAAETVGNYYFHLYKLDSAQYYYQKSEVTQVALSGVQDPTVARLYYHLGNVSSYQHNTNAAAIYFEKAYTIYQQLSSPPPNDYANLLFSMGNNYSQKGQFNQAELYLNEARPIYEDIYGKNSSNLGSLVHSMAIVQYFQKKTFYAKKLILEALDIYKREEINHQIAIAQLYDMLGRIALVEEEYAQALTCYEATKKNYENIYGAQSEALASVYRDIATVYMKMKDTTKGQAYFGRAIELAYTQNLPTVLAQTYLVMGNVYNISYCQYAFNALVPSFRTFSVQANPSLTDVKKGCYNYRFLVEIFNDKLSLLLEQKTRLPDSMQYTMANIALDLVLKSDSICTYILSEHVGKNDQKEYLSIFSNIYMLGQQVCLDLYTITRKEKYLKQGFYFSEQYKSFLLKDALKEGDALDFGGVPTLIRQQYKNLQKTLAIEKAALLELQVNKDTLGIGLKSKAILETGQTLEKLKKQLANDYPKYHQLQHRRSSIEAKTVQKQLLDEQTAMIEYMIGDSVTIIHVLTNKSISVYQTISQDKLNYLLKKFIRQLKNPVAAKLEVFAKNAYELYKILLQEPLASLPKAVDKLIVVPDKNLVNLPFEVLLTGDGGQPILPYNQLPYLLKKYRINYSYSAALLLENKNRNKKKNTGFLSLAASYDTSVVQKSTIRVPYIQKVRKNLSTLPYAEREVKQLEETYQGTFLYANEANERQFKQLANGFSIIHLALHGLTNKVSPTFSGLLFSENLDSLEDNMLFLHEISNLELHTDMVVLSACETGIGRYAEGEGAMSLARAFMYAGAGSVVMSLWSVNDHSTQLLMTDFYEQLSMGIPKDEALRQAKLNYLAKQKGKHAHPAFWAAFVHLGNDEAITIPLKKNKDLLLYLGIGGLLLAALILLGRWRLLATTRSEL